MGTFFANLSNRFPDSYAAGWIEHEPEFTAVARFTNSSDEIGELHRLATVEGFDLRIEVASTAPTDHEIEDVVAGVADQVDSVEGLVGVDFDVVAGEVVLLFAGLPQKSAERAVVASLRTDVPVRVNSYEDSAAGDDVNVYGGFGISPNCTTGFVVRNSSNQRSVLSAGHGVEKPKAYSGHTMEVQQILRDSTRDVVRYNLQGSHTYRAQFYVGSNLRNVSGTLTRSSQPIGGVVCHQGKTTSYSCGNLVSRVFKPTWSGACPGTECASLWMRVEGPALACSVGDSGGPWFNSGTAYGIHKGGSNSGPAPGQCNFAVSMAINYISPLNYSVATS